MFWTSWLCSGRRSSAVQQPRSDIGVLPEQPRSGSSVLAAAVQIQTEQIANFERGFRQYSDSVQTQQQEQQLVQQQLVAELERTRAADGEELQQLQDQLAATRECAVCLGDQCVALLPCRHVCRAWEQQYSSCPLCLKVVESSHEVEFTAIESVP
jgi:hypothetical protein